MSRPAYRFAFEGLPQNRAIFDRELRITRAWPYFPWRDFHNVHNANAVEFPIARPLQVIVKLCLQPVRDLTVEERRMDADFALERPEEEHSGRERRVLGEK